MSDTTEIIETAIDELRLREERIEREIAEVTEKLKPELKEIRKAIRRLEGAGGTTPGNGSPPRSDSEPSAEPTTESKDAVMAHFGTTKKGARQGQIADATGMSVALVKASLLELEESGDVQRYGVGMWRVKALPPLADEDLADAA